MSSHIVTQNKQENWTWGQKQSTLYKCSLKLLCYLCLAIQLQRATRIACWILSVLCPTQQRKNRQTWFIFDVMEAGKRWSNRLSSEGQISTKIITILKLQYTTCKCSPDSYLSLISQKADCVITLHQQTYAVSLPVQHGGGVGGGGGGGIRKF